MGFRRYELGSYEEMCARTAGTCPSATTSPRTSATSTTRDRLAMVWEDWQGNERRVSFGELQDLSSRFANVLEAHGVEREDRVATLLPSLPETAAVFIGTYKRGAILLSMSVLYGDDGIEHRLRDSQAKAVVTDAANRDRIPDGLVDEVLVLDDGAAARSSSRRRPTYEIGRHRRRRPGAALLLVGHHGQGQGHPARAPLPARPRGVRVLPRRARRRALPRLGRVGLGRRHLPAARPVALRRRRARAGAQGRLRPRGAPALPLQARRAEHVHHAHRAARDDRRRGRRGALPADRAAHRVLRRRAAQPGGDPLVPRPVRDHGARLLRADRELPAVRQLPDRRGARGLDGQADARLGGGDPRRGRAARRAGRARRDLPEGALEPALPASATGTAPRTPRRSSAATGSTPRTPRRPTRTATTGTPAAPTT